MAENKDDTQKVTEIQLPKPREDLINTAVKFLQNSNVQRSSLAHRQAFLKKKGLTDEEIKLSCERAGAFDELHKNGQLETMLQQVPVPALHQPTYILPPPTRWNKFKDLANNVAIIGGITYMLYLFYKKYIMPFLFGIKKKQKSIEESITELNEGLKKIQENLEKINELQQQQPELNNSSSKQIQELKTEISTVKGLLLSRHQFPAATSSNSVVPPSIPAWQLSSAPQVPDGDEGEQGQKGDIEVCTSGSGSSENEAVINTGSDSSLEMIRE